MYYQHKLLYHSSYTLDFVKSREGTKEVFSLWYGRQPFATIVLCAPYLPLMYIVSELPVQLMLYYQPPSTDDYSVSLNVPLISACGFTFCLLFINICWIFTRLWKVDNFVFTKYTTFLLFSMFILWLSMNIVIVLWLESFLQIYVVFTSYNLMLNFVQVNYNKLPAPSLTHLHFLVLKPGHSQTALQHSAAIKKYNLKLMFVFLLEIVFHILFGFIIALKMKTANPDLESMGWFVGLSLMWVDLPIFIVKLTDSGSPSAKKRAKLRKTIILTRLVMAGASQHWLFFICFSFNFLMCMSFMIQEAIEHFQPANDELSYTIVLNDLLNGSISLKFSRRSINLAFGIVLMLLTYLAWLMTSFYNLNYATLKYQIFRKIDVQGFIITHMTIGVLTLTVLSLSTSSMYFAQTLKVSENRVTRSVLTSALAFIASNFIMFSVCFFNLRYEEVTVGGTYNLELIIDIMGLALFFPITALVCYLFYVLWKQDNFRWTNWLFNKQVEYDRLARMNELATQRFTLDVQEPEHEGMEFWTINQARVLKPRICKTAPLGPRPQYFTSEFFYDALLGKLNTADYVRTLLFFIFLASVYSLYHFCDNLIATEFVPLALIMFWIKAVANTMLLSQLTNTFRLSIASAVFILAHIGANALLLYNNVLGAASIAVFITMTVVYLCGLSFFAAVYLWYRRGFKSTPQIVLCAVVGYFILLGIFIACEILLSPNYVNIKYRKLWQANLILLYFVCVLAGVTAYQWQEHGYRVPSFLQWLWWPVTLVTLGLVTVNVLAYKNDAFYLAGSLFFLIPLFFVLGKYIAYKAPPNSPRIFSRFVFPIYHIELPADAGHQPLLTPANADPAFVILSCLFFIAWGISGVLYAYRSRDVGSLAIGFGNSV